MKRTKFRIFLRFLRINFESFIWLCALLLLAFMNPEDSQATLCIWHYVGFDSCPGCGLGHSISAAFHGNFMQSFEYHPLGIIAILVLGFRSIHLIIQNNFSPFKNNMYV